MILEAKIEIKRKIDEVYHYLQDFSQVYEWDPHISEGHRLDYGEIIIGSKFLLNYSFFGLKKPLIYTLTNKKEFQLLKFNCTEKNIVSNDQITLQQKNETTVVLNYQAELIIKNKIINAIFIPIMKFQAKKVVQNIKTTLESSYNSSNKIKSFSFYNIPFSFTSKGWNRNRIKFNSFPSGKKKIIITGPTSGLGKACTLQLASKGCELILVARNKNKLDQLSSDLKDKGYPYPIQQYICEMENIEQVKKICEDIKSNNNHVDALINNAGSLFTHSKLINGIEQTTVVDLISPWIMSCNLIPILRSGGTIINVSSGGMYGVPLNILELKKSSEPFSGSKAYAHAKRAMVVMSQVLNEELKDKNIKVHSMHPGWADTPGVLKSLPTFYKMTKRFLRTPFQGADTISWLALTNPEKGGCFWLDRSYYPLHIFKSTKGSEDDYKNLKKFLSDFARIPKS